MLDKKIKTDSNKFFLNNIFHFIEYVMSFRILIVMLLLTLLSGAAFLSSALGIYVSVIIFVASMKFAVEILNTTAHGLFQPDDVANTNQDASIILKMIGIGLVYFIALYFAANSGNENIILFVMYGGLFIMPAVYMVLSVTESMSQALNPIIIFKFIQPWFINYLLFFVFYLLTSFIQSHGIEVLATNYLPSRLAYFVLNFFKLFFLFLNFQIMGFLIYQNSESFGMETEVITNDIIHVDDVESINQNPIHERIKSLLDSGEVDNALAIIGEIKKDGDNSTELIALSQQAEIMKNEQKDIPNSLKVHQFIEKDEIGNAFRLFIEMHHNQEEYLEQSASDLSELAKHAYSTQKYPMVIKLLNNFSKKHPNHDDIVPNYFLIVQILYQNPKSQDKAKSILNSLIVKYPNHKMNAELQSWKKGIELVNTQIPI